MVLPPTSSPKDAVKPVLCLLLGVFLFAACQSSSTDKAVGPPDQLLRKGMKAAKKKDTEKAKQLFSQVLEDYPDSDERVPALMLLADTLYRSKEYEEAKFNYKKFTELYPAHENVAHAHYFKAMSDFKLIDLDARDQTVTQNALDQFEFIINQFPNTPYREKAEARKKQCLDMLASNLLFVAKYYFRIGGYQSTIQRIQDIFLKYPDNKFNDEALYLLAESYYHEQNFLKATEHYNKLLREHPKSAYAKEAKSRLKSLPKT